MPPDIFVLSPCMLTAWFCAELTSRSILRPWWYTSVSKVIRCSSSVTIKEAYNSRVTPSDNGIEFSAATEESKVPWPHYTKKVPWTVSGTYLYTFSLEHQDPQGQDPQT